MKMSSAPLKDQENLSNEPRPALAMDLKRRTVLSIGWAASSQLFRVGLLFVVTTILARELSPDDFGLVAMVMVFMSLAELLNDMGLPAAIINKNDISEEDLSSAFWANAVEGAVIMLVFAAAAPIIAAFYNNEELVPISIALSTTFFISSFGMIQMGIFSKELDFKTIFKIEVTSTGLGGAFAIGLAFSGAGVWSLVCKTLITSAIRSLLLFIISSWKPKRMFRWASVKGLLKFGLNQTGFKILHYFRTNLDNMFIGKFLGAAQLGAYNLAYRLLLFPLGSISQTIGKVMFPALSVIQDNERRVREGYIRANRIIALIAFPLMVGLIAVAPLFIRTVYGEQWEEAIFVVQVLSLVGFGQSITTTVSWLYLSQGRPDILFKWSILATTLAAISFLIGLKWGINGVAVSYAICNFLLFYPEMAIPFRLINLKVTNFLKSLWKVALSSVIMATLVYIFRVLVIEKYLDIGNFISLFLCVLLGIVIYTATIFITEREIIGEIVALMKGS